MAKNNTRLELTWIGKENRPKLGPRILIEESAKVVVRKPVQLTVGESIL